MDNDQLGIYELGEPTKGGDLGQATSREYAKRLNVGTGDGQNGRRDKKAEERRPARKEVESTRRKQVGSGMSGRRSLLDLGEEECEGTPDRLGELGRQLGQPDLAFLLRLG